MARATWAERRVQEIPHAAREHRWRAQVRARKRVVAAQLLPRGRDLLAAHAVEQNAAPNLNAAARVAAAHHAAILHDARHNPRARQITRDRGAVEGGVRDRELRGGEGVVDDRLGGAAHRGTHREAASS